MDNRKTIQTIFNFALLGLMFALLIGMLYPFFTIILWTIFLYILINPLHSMLLKKLNKDKKFYQTKRHALAGVFSLGTLLVIIVPLVSIGILLTNQLLSFVKSVETFIMNNPDFFSQSETGIILSKAAEKLSLNFINLRKYVYLRPVGAYDFRQHIKPISIFFAMSIATTVYTNMDNVMLGFIKGATENGYYDAAVKIKNILVSFVSSLGTVLLPRVSYYIQTGEREEFSRITKKALNFVFLLSVPLCVYFIIFARSSIYLLSGTLFENSILPMRLIMPTLVFIGLTNIIGLQILVPLGKENQVLYSEIAGAAVNIIVNMLLIPRMGAAGAAIGTVLAEIMVFIVQVYALKDVVVRILKKISYWKIATALLLASFASVWVSSMNWGDFLILLFSALLFFGVYVLALIVFREKLVKEILDDMLRIVKKNK